MNPTPARWLRGLALGALVVAWAILAHYGSSAAGGSDLAVILGTAPIVVVALMLLWRSASPLVVGLAGLLVGGLLIWAWPLLRQNVELLYYIQHLGTNLALATLFGKTLFGGREALITQFAKMAHGGQVSPLKARYTRRLTGVWTGFFLLVASISTGLFWLATPTAWSIFANLLSTPLIALMFIGEHLLRGFFLPPEEQTSIADAIRGYRETMRRRNDTLADQP